MVKSAVVGMEQTCLAQMPLAENAGAITSFLKSIRHRRHTGPQQAPALNRMRNGGTKLVSTSHESRACWRTSRTRDKIREANATSRERIEMGSFKMRITLEASITKTLVIG